MLAPASHSRRWALGVVAGIVVVALVVLPRMEWRSSPVTPLKEVDLDHETIRARACEALLAKVREADAGEGYEAVMYGDSITEYWLGTSRNIPAPYLADYPVVFARRFGGVSVLPLGIAGDTVPQLAARVASGELPRRVPRAVIVLIGTNDLSLATAAHGGEPRAAWTPGAAATVAKGIELVLAMLREAYPASHIFAQALLPRGLPQGESPWAPPGWGDLIGGVNDRLRRAVESPTLAPVGDAGGNLTFLDCGPGFLRPEGGLNPDLMPDGLHPGVAGLEVLADCLLGAMKEAGVAMPAGAAAAFASASSSSP